MLARENPSWQTVHTYRLSPTRIYTGINKCDQTVDFAVLTGRSGNIVIKIVNIANTSLLWVNLGI